jgi:hypothetical protein
MAGNPAERKSIMAMQTATLTASGIGGLLLNNPQCVDRFNSFARRMKAINDKKTRRTDDDYLELRDLEVASKLYFDDAAAGVYVPGTWVIESIAGSAFGVAKLSRDKTRGSLFVQTMKIPLKYAGMELVKAPADIIKNPKFVHTMALPQGQVRVVKCFPIFHNWSFEVNVEFDDSIMDFGMLSRIAEYSGKYVGYGDLRPTFGRAKVEVK